MTQRPIPNLGRLEVVPLREVWAHEAHEFTPWLLNNPDVLGEILGMDLELTRAEHPVGGFSLDLIGRDSATDERVIVENQLEVSDHSHLGQLLTYASGTDATNIVWVASAFREEHRAALDWLNARTDEHTRFFAVEVSAVRIGESPAAPLLKLVAEPNDWNKIVKAVAAKQSGGERAGLYTAFWAAYLEKLHQTHPTWTRATKAPNVNWISLASGTPNVTFGTNFSRKGLCSEIYLGDPESSVNQERLDRLRARRLEFEAIVGPGVEWQDLKGRKACRVAVYLAGASVENRDEWSAYIGWFLSSQERLRKAYADLG